MIGVLREGAVRPRRSGRSRRWPTCPRWSTSARRRACRSATTCSVGDLRRCRWRSGATPTGSCRKGSPTRASTRRRTAVGCCVDGGRGAGLTDRGPQPVPGGRRRRRDPGRRHAAWSGSPSGRASPAAGSSTAPPIRLGRLPWLVRRLAAVAGVNAADPRADRRRRPAGARRSRDDARRLAGHRLVGRRPTAPGRRAGRRAPPRRGADGHPHAASSTAWPPPSSLRARSGAPQVIVLTTFQADDHVLRALRAGASGFLLKDTPPADILRAVRRVAVGEAILSPSVTRRLIAHVADAGPTRGRPRPATCSTGSPTANVRSRSRWARASRTRRSAPTST